MLNTGYSERVGWHGHVRVWVQRDGLWQLDFDGPNVITDAGKDLLASGLMGAADTELKYLAWGDDDTAPAAGDTALGNELGRKLVTAQAAGTTGVILTTTWLSPQDANEQIEEIGWYAGPAASGTADSGVLVARVLYSHNKTELEAVQVDRTDTVG